MPAEAVAVHGITNERLAAEFTVHRYDQAKDKAALAKQAAGQVRAIATSAPEGRQGPERARLEV